MRNAKRHSALDAESMDPGSVAGVTISSICWTLAFILFLNACQSSLQSTSASGNLPTPLIYAHYESLPLLMRTKPGTCKQSYYFNVTSDFCGSLDGKTWQLPSGIQSFHVEQTFNPSQQLKLEILDDGGVPWPSLAQTRRKDSHVLLELKPSQSLPANSIFNLQVSVVGGTGQKISSWKIPFRINS